jgi:hypothetical protein
VLGVEKLLPVVERNEQTKDDCNSFLQMYKKHLANSLYSLMSEIISLLAYSKHAVLNKGNAGNVY